MSVRQRKFFRGAVCAALLAAVALTAVFTFANDKVLSESAADAAAVSSIKQGATGSTVKTIQTKLKSAGLYTGAIDGIFGPKTTAAVKAYQKQKGLVADGIVGPKTAAAMGISLSGSSTTTTSTTANSSNVNLIARCVYGEARGEPYTGQVAVAAVILNRVKSSLFPNTISGVIYQAGAFDAVKDGQINLAPNDSAIRAAQDALNGWDPTNGCLFYYNPKTATNAWIKQKPIYLTVGNHVFCK